MWNKIWRKLTHTKRPTTNSYDRRLFEQVYDFTDCCNWGTGMMMGAGVFTYLPVVIKLVYCFCYFCLVVLGLIWLQLVVLFIKLEDHRLRPLVFADIITISCTLSFSPCQVCGRTQYSPLLHPRRRHCLHLCIRIHRTIYHLPLLRGNICLQLLDIWWFHGDPIGVLPVYPTSHDCSGYVYQSV